MKNIKGLFYAIISAITFGLIPLFTVPIQQHGNLDTGSILFYRFLFGAIIMGVLSILAGKHFKIKFKELGVLLFFGINYVITALGLMYSYEMIPSGIATTIHALYPITVTLFAIFFLKEKISSKLILAILGSVTGVTIMCWVGGDVNLQGIALAGMTTITYTIYILLMSKSKVRNLDPMILNFYIMVFGAILLYGILSFTPLKPIMPITVLSDWINLILLALIPTVISNILFIMAVKRVGATRTAIMGSFEPSTAILVGVLYFGENMGIGGTIGFALIIISTIVVILNSGSRK